MTTHVDDGGPAFGIPGVLTFDPNRKEFTGLGPYQGNVSVRDYFAAAALSSYQHWGRLNPEGTLSNFTDTAQDCYAMADAMVQARKSQP